MTIRLPSLEFILHFYCVTLLLNAFTVNMEYHQWTTIFFWFDLIWGTMQVPLTMLYMFSWLSYFFMYHNPRRHGFRSFLDDFTNATDISCLSLFGHLSGKKMSLSLLNDQMDNFIKDSNSKWLPVIIDMFYDNDVDLKRDQHRYRYKYQQFRFRRFHQVDKVLRQPVLSSKHGFLIKNINQMNQCYVCQSCRLIFREPCQLLCGHRQCQTCLSVANEYMFSCDTIGILKLLSFFIS